MAVTDVEFRTDGGYLLQGRLWVPDDGNVTGIVVASHGVNPLEDYSRKYVKLAEEHIKRGIGWLNFFHTGYGTSEPVGSDPGARIKQTTIQQRVYDIINAVDFLEFRGVGSFALYGSSFGGAAAMVASVMGGSAHNALVTWNRLGPNKVREIMKDKVYTENDDVYRIMEEELPQAHYLMVVGMDDNDSMSEMNRVKGMLERSGVRGNRVEFHQVRGGDHDLEQDYHFRNALGKTLRHFRGNLNGRDTRRD